MLLRLINNFARAAARDEQDKGEEVSIAAREEDS